MFSCNFFLLSLSFVAFASASDLKLDQYNLLSSYYLFRRSKLTEGAQLSLPLTKYCEFAKDFFFKSPKDCLTIVMDARDDFFSSFFFSIALSSSCHLYNFTKYFYFVREQKFTKTERLEGLSWQFEYDCNKVAKDLWSIPFIKGDQNEYLERLERLEILLCIMKHFAVVLREGETKKSLLVSYNSLKFVMRNFKVNADHVPSYEGFLITFDTIRSLSRTHKGEWPTDSTTAENLMKLFRFYSHHFSHNHFNELPTTVPSLLLLLILLEESSRRNDVLFSHFSQNSPGDLEVSLDYPTFFDLNMKLESFFFERKKRNHPKISIWNFRITTYQLSKGRSFFIFLHKLITSESGIMPTSEAKDGSLITLNLDEREKWLIKVFLKLYGRKHLHNLYLTE